MKNKALLKKIGNIVLNILLYLFLAICVFAVILTVVSKRDSDGAATFFGHQMRLVTSPSMAECDLTDVSAYEIGSIPVNSVVFVETVPEDKESANDWYASLKKGDVLTFRYVYTQQLTITHRIESIEANDHGGYTIVLTGDNKNDDSGILSQTIDTANENSPNYVIGKVTAQNYPLGLFLSILSKPVGIVLIIIVPCFIIILLEVMRIVGVVSAEKKKREQEEQAKRESEIEELRRKLAALENQNQSHEEENEE